MKLTASSIACSLYPLKKRVVCCKMLLALLRTILIQIATLCLSFIVSVIQQQPGNLKSLIRKTYFFNFKIVFYYLNLILLFDLDYVKQFNTVQIVIIVICCCFHCKIVSY